MERPTDTERYTMTTYAVEGPDATEQAKQPPYPGIRKLVAGDIMAWMKLWMPQRAAAGKIGVFDVIRLLWNYCGLRAVLLYRLSHALWKGHVPVLPGIFAQLNVIIHGFDVPSCVEIGPGLYVPHPVGTVIMASRIGANVSLISSITIGMRNVPEFPTIGSNVFVGAGARILGNIVIGDDVNIGANAVVLMDIPSGATAVGVPARILARKPAPEQAGQ